MATAKIFQSGNSQAVRIPKKFRFQPKVTEVSITKEGSRIVLEPLDRKEWPKDFWEAFGGMPDDFERPQQVAQVREDLEL